MFYMRSQASFKIMDIHKINRMWRIDGDAQVGNDIKEEDRLFFNQNFDNMLEEMESDYNHWRHHTSKLQ